ncbi:hypothetical protein M5X17_31100 [Paenibacillus alvei]|uniref:hypothetical protein n=1 Tax=Paenibacillus alvei TaxID=44250 RepID=UPI00227ED3CC|nr:hypothetical protein [Paenibacillus alvei]MCY9738141.1 hypothetical protein [Paenibacillus alvei]
MNDADRELFIARVKGLMDDERLLPEIRQTKSLLIHYAHKEDWDRVAELAEELKILREERILRLEAKCQ